MKPSRLQFLGLCAFCLARPLFADEATTPNLFDAGSMNHFVEEANPWAGVDSNGNLRGLQATQLGVDDSGNIGKEPMSPSVAVGDLNGDGLLDLVVADPKGFFWFYPNSGTKTQPKFTDGEIMPIWLGSPAMTDDELRELKDKDKDGRAVDHLVPRIQLIDTQGSGKLDLVVGTYPGKLFIVRNEGTPLRPKFETPKDLYQLKEIHTTADGILDCAFLSPYLYDWTGTGRLDLLRGDGTYAANSIFLYTNVGTSDQAAFNETNRTKIIPGMGREHLVPQVIDWNNDGKPDIISGEREGYIDLFLNVSDDRAHPSFDQGQHLHFGGQEKFGKFTTVTTAPLTGNPQVPDVLISNDTGEIYFCHNTGTAGKPGFASVPQPLKGTNILPKILVSKSWALGSWNFFDTDPLDGWSEGSPYGVPYKLLVVTNATKEPAFAPPSDVTWKNALKYEGLDHAAGVYFPTTFYPAEVDDADKHSICCTQKTTLDSESEYKISFWIKGDGIHDVSYRFHGGQLINPDANDNLLNPIEITHPVDVNDSWSKVEDTVLWNTTNGKVHDSVGFWFDFNFYGEGSLYISDVQLHKASS